MPDRSISPSQAEFENIPNFGDAGEVLDVVNDKVLIFDADDAEGGDINSNKGQKPKVITVGELRSFSAANTNFKMISSLYAVQDADMGGVLIASSEDSYTLLSLDFVTIDGRIVFRANAVQAIYLQIDGIIEFIEAGEQKELVRADGVWQILDNARYGEEYVFTALPLPPADANGLIILDTDILPANLPFDPFWANPQRGSMTIQIDLQYLLGGQSFNNRIIYNLTTKLVSGYIRVDEQQHVTASGVHVSVGFTVDFQNHPTTNALQLHIQLLSTNTDHWTNLQLKGVVKP